MPKPQPQQFVTVNRRGCTYQRRRSSLDAKRVKSDPAFAASQIRAKEYGGSATAGKHLREGLGPMQHLFLGGMIHSAIANLLRKGLQFEPDNGKPRPFRFENAWPFLSELCLSASTRPLHIPHFAPRLTLTNKPKGRQITLTLPELDHTRHKFPAGATHFAIVCFVQPVNDFVFNSKLGSYQPVNALLQHKAHAHLFPWISLKASKPIATQSPFKCQVDAPQKGVSHIVWWGIICAQKVGEQFYTLNMGTALRPLAFLPDRQQTPKAERQTLHQPQANLPAMPKLLAAAGIAGFLNLPLDTA
jgi:hypothetical protein